MKCPIKRNTDIVVPMATRDYIEIIQICKSLTKMKEKKIWLQLKYRQYATNSPYT